MACNGDKLENSELRKYVSDLTTYLEDCDLCYACVLKVAIGAIALEYMVKRDTSVSVISDAIMEGLASALMAELAVHNTREKKS